MNVPMRGVCRLVAAGVLLAAAGMAVPLAVSAAEPAVPEGEMKAGEELYVANCRMCHGTKGTAGTPLAGNAKLEDADFVAHTIISGPGYMTPFGEHLDDEQIAKIVTYVRNSWGNAYGPMTADAVAKQR